MNKWTASRRFCLESRVVFGVSGKREPHILQELEEETGELSEPIYQEMSVVPGKNTASAPEEPNT